MSDIENKKPISNDEIHQLLKGMDKELKRSKPERDSITKKIAALTKATGNALKNLDSQVSHVLNTMKAELPVINQHDSRLNALSFSLSEKTENLHKKRNGLAFSFRNRLNLLKEEIKNTYLATLEKNQDLFDALRVNLENYTTKTRIIDSKTTTAGETINFIEFTGEGNMKQLYIASNVNTYNIRIIIDDEILFAKPYTYFFSHSAYISDVSAFLNAGIYYLSLRDNQFQNDMKVEIITPAITVFSELYARYDIRKEKKLEG